MKTKEELNALKEAVNQKLAELNEEEMEQVTGGLQAKLHGEWLCPNCGYSWGPLLPPIVTSAGRTCPSCRNKVEPVWEENQ